MGQQANEQDLVGKRIVDNFQRYVGLMAVVINQSPGTIGSLLRLLIISLEPAEGQFRVAPPSFGHCHTAFKWSVAGCSEIEATYILTMHSQYCDQGLLCPNESVGWHL